MFFLSSPRILKSSSCREHLRRPLVVVGVETGTLEKWIEDYQVIAAKTSVGKAGVAGTTADVAELSSLQAETSTR